MIICSSSEVKLPWREQGKNMLQHTLGHCGAVRSAGEVGKDKGEDGHTAEGEDGQELPGCAIEVTDEGEEGTEDSSVLAGVEG